ncbi:hypothetical protein [Aquabacterium sp.]|uniref:hypothetical protein n=1 Tax=Aquabacterium sp. TaxID=1872578 RepID=UPI0025C562B7|nr:hypothetical protein [Aquabacterium sp.]
MKVWMAACSLLAFAAIECRADTVADALLSGQVQQFMDDGSITGCGVVLSAVETGVGANQTAHVFHGSISVMGLTGGLVKGRVSTIPGKKLLAGDASALAIQAARMVWVKAPGAPATALLPGQRVHQSEDRGYILYGAALPPLVDVMFAVQDGKPIQIGMRTAKANYDVILAGVVEMSPAQQQQLAQCLGEFVAHVNRSEGGKASK